jgi:YNFM family putative membrane transporter
MKKNNLFMLVYCIIVVLSVMYATQPLQPLLANKFEISILKASQFTAVIMFFLAISPIVYGYFLEKICAKKMLFNALFVLLITNIFLGLSNTYEWFLFFRVCEALVIPAVLTSLMSILVNIDKQNIKFNMSIYVASTVFGGLVGRVFSGFIATTFSYEYVFYSLSFAIALSLILVKQFTYEGEASLNKPKLKDITNILKDKKFVLIYFLMFGIFFVFAGVLNVLPFRVKDISSTFSEFQISLLYLGYGMGIIVSLASRKIVNFFKGEINTILISLILFLGVSFFLVNENVLFLFFILFLFCIAMFTIHTVSSGLANSMKEEKKSLTSGMYLTFYYIGGAFGSIIPSIIYEQFGWNIMIYSFIFILISMIVVVYKSRKIFN